MTQMNDYSSSRFGGKKPINNNVNDPIKEVKECEECKRLQAKIKQLKSSNFALQDMLDDALKQVGHNSEKVNQGKVYLSEDNRNKLGRRRALTMSEALEIVSEHNKGVSYGTLAKRFGVAKATVINYYQKMNKGADIYE